ncbi:uncharacterized membrane protein YvlD (DUF360 family) [Paenibacillus phyllosphaerae]|uniref:Uncharacterized membrane protein YvlD (DUF360 family) n=1 Tax=Paenibacillus phyllosphaerae TaxID=274593 RepID=A0A7W5AWF8_9BACL|nr:DUF4184 family protein [Paenibacillus phyllosphaerae]MBB3110045.1 uncharacterized membrane protein YvlD (DUF360 family) [Paenibacillus phyllosphaerae]
MPFTFAHPAFAFPLKFIRPRWFSVTGLVLGSMSPDFEYFLALEPHQTIGHSFSGLLIQAIPLSILFAFLFHVVVKRTMVLHLPSVLDLNRRAYGLLSGWGLGTAREWLIFLMSVIIGFLTHVGLDSFTHEGGYMVKQLPWLQSNAIFDLPVYKLMQHGLSLLGLSAILITLAAALWQSEPSAKRMPHIAGRRKWLFWCFSFLFALFVMGIKILVNDSGNYIGITVVATLTGFCAGLLIASLIWRAP